MIVVCGTDCCYTAIIAGAIGGVGLLGLLLAAILLKKLRSVAPEAPPTMWSWQDPGVKVGENPLFIKPTGVGESSIYEPPRQ